MEDAIIDLCKATVKGALPSGWCGVLLLCVFALYSILAFYHAVRRRPERVFQDAVISVYILAGFSLCQLAGVVPHCLPATPSFTRESMILTSAVNTFCWTAAMSMILLSFLALPVIAAMLQTRQKKSMSEKTKCIPGAIVGLLGILVCYLIFLFEYALIDWDKNLGAVFCEMRNQREQIKELEQRIMSQNERLVGIVTNVPNHQQKTSEQSIEVSPSAAFTDSQKQRLDQIQKQYHIMKMSVVNKTIYLTIGLMPSDKITALRNDILSVVGAEYRFGAMIVK